MKIIGLIASIVLFFAELRIGAAIIETFKQLTQGDTIASIALFILEIIGLISIPVFIFTILKMTFTSGG